MYDSSPSTWTTLLTLLVAVLGGGTVLGLLTLWVNRGKPAVEKAFVEEQTDKAREEARSVRIQSELSLVKSAMDMVARVEAELCRKDEEIAELKKRLAQFDAIALEIKKATDERDKAE